MGNSIGQETDRQVLNLIGEGWTAVAIRKHLGMTKHALASRVRRLRDAGESIPYMRQEAYTSSLDGRSVSLHRYCLTVESDPARASAQHLLDLKRAGHSPTRTEYRITTERPCAPRSYPAFGSLMGSPAFMCSES